MRIKVKESVGEGVLAAVTAMLLDGLAAWELDGELVIYEGNVEVAALDVDGLTPAEARDLVQETLRGI